MHPFNCVDFFFFFLHFNVLILTKVCPEVAHTEASNILCFSFVNLMNSAF